MRDNRAEKIRLREINRNQVVKKIELINKEDELKRSLTLYCKYCKSWFSSKDFDIICPKCDNDQIFVAYLCENCNKWIFKDEPREDFYCKHKKCEGIRLIRREKAEIKNFLAQKGNILREFKKKIKKFSILDGMQE